MRDENGISVGTFMYLVALGHCELGGYLWFWLDAHTGIGQVRRERLEKSHTPQEEHETSKQRIH
jgi:hypothetical protein